jgi:hypothetical protein
MTYTRGAKSHDQFPTLPFLWTLHDTTNGVTVGCFGYNECWALEAAMLASAAPSDAEPFSLEPLGIKLLPFECVNWKHVHGAFARGAVPLEFTTPFEIFLADDAPEWLVQLVPADALRPGVIAVMSPSAISSYGERCDMRCRPSLFPHGLELITADGSSVIQAFELRRTPLTAREMTALPFYNSTFLQLNRENIVFGTPGIDDIDIPVSSLERVGVPDAMEAMRAIAYVHGAVAFVSAAGQGRNVLPGDPPRGRTSNGSPYLPTNDNHPNSSNLGECSASAAQMLIKQADIHEDFARHSKLAAATFDYPTLRLHFHATESDVTLANAAHYRLPSRATPFASLEAKNSVEREKVMHDDLPPEVDNGECPFTDALSQSFFFTNPRFRDGDGPVGDEVESDGMNPPHVAPAHTRPAKHADPGAMVTTPQQHPARNAVAVSPAPQHGSPLRPAPASGGSGSSHGAISVRFAAVSQAALTAVLHDALRWLLAMERVTVPQEWAAAQPALGDEEADAQSDDDGAAAPHRVPPPDAGGVDSEASRSRESDGAEGAVMVTNPPRRAPMTPAERCRAVAEKLGIKIPANITVPFHETLLHFVRPNSSEYKEVISCFSQNLFSHTVICVQRVQNQQLWEKYTMQLRQVAKENAGDANELQWMKHGTRMTTPLTICTTGFDHRYCEKGMYGRATYFAYSTRYAHLFRHDLPDSGQMPDGSTAAQLILSRVARGRVDVRPKSDTELKHPALGCHTIEGPVTADGLLAIMTYELHQAYPAYIITYLVPLREQATHATPMSAAVSKPAVAATPATPAAAVTVTLPGAKTPAKAPAAKSAPKAAPKPAPKPAPKKK